MYAEVMASHSVLGMYLIVDGSYYRFFALSPPVNSFEKVNSSPHKIYAKK
jgi:hypothetical protein